MNSLIHSDAHRVPPVPVFYTDQGDPVYAASEVAEENAADEKRLANHTHLGQLALGVIGVFGGICLLAGPGRADWISGQVANFAGVVFLASVLIGGGWSAWQSADAGCPGGGE